MRKRRGLEHGAHRLQTAADLGKERWHALRSTHRGAPRRQMHPMRPSRGSNVWAGHPVRGAPRHAGAGIGARHLEKKPYFPVFAHARLYRVPHTTAEMS